MSKAKKLIMFDFDGVIVDSFDFCYEIISQIEPGLTKAQYRRRFEGNVFDEIKKVKRTAGFMPERNDEFFKYYEPRLMKQPVVPGMKPVLHQLSRRYTLVIISSTLSVVIERFLTHHGIRSYFLDIYGPRISLDKVVRIRKALKRYKTRATETVFITDTLGDVREAREADVDSIGVLWGYQSKATLKKGTPGAYVTEPKKLFTVINDYFSKI